MTRIVNAAGVFTVDGTTVWVDTTNNRLGVVNPNPTVELDVIGDAEISGSLSVAGNTVLTDASMATLPPLTVIADADGIFILDDGTGVLNKTTFTGIKDWIRGDGVIVGRDGGVNELRIRDDRDEGERTPNDYHDKAVTFSFTDDISGSPNSWDSVMTLKGWSDNYRAWQIWSSSASGSQSVDEVPLYFRSGEDDVQLGWGITKEILTFPGNAPVTDGSAGQVLQTDGAGTLSWATISGGGGITIGDAVGSGTPGSILFVDGSNNLAQDNGELYWDNTNNRLGIGTTSPTASIEVDAGAATEYAILSTGANGRIGLTTQYGGIHFDNVEGTDDLWQLSERDSAVFDIAFGTPDPGNNVVVSDTKMRITDAGNVGIGLGSTNPSTALHVNGTIRQTNSTNAVLVSDGNGDIGSASNLQDIGYVQPGQSENDVFTAGASAPFWGPPGPPATIQEAIDRLAAFVGGALGIIP